MRTPKEKARIVIDALRGKTFTEIAREEGVSATRISGIFNEVVGDATKESGDTPRDLMTARADQARVERCVREWATDGADGARLSRRVENALRAEGAWGSQEHVRRQIESGILTAGSFPNFGKKALQEAARWSGASIPSGYPGKRQTHQQALEDAVHLLERHGYTVIPPGGSVGAD